MNPGAPAGGLGQGNSIEPGRTYQYRGIHTNTYTCCVPHRPPAQAPGHPSTEQGRVCAELLCPYPQGLPVAYPGEHLSGAVASGGHSTGGKVHLCYRLTSSGGCEPLLVQLVYACTGILPS